MRQKTAAFFLLFNKKVLFDKQKKRAYQLQRLSIDGMITNVRSLIPSHRLIFFVVNGSI